MATNNVPRTLCLYQMLEEIVDNEIVNMPITSTNTLSQMSTCILGSTVKQIRPTIEGFVDKVVSKLTAVDFRRHFRISTHVYEHLLTVLRPDLAKQHRDGQEPVPPETQLLVFLWYVSNQDAQREIAVLFGVSEWSVNTIVKHVSEIVCSRVDNYIKMPNLDRETSISNSFEGMCGIANIVGALDGTHIPIVNCPGGNADYVNRKGFSSVQLQLIVDDTLLINNAYVGWPGSTHDARVLRNCKIYADAEQATVISQNKFIIGDGAYPLRRWLITPYRENGHLSMQQKKCNKCLSSARQCVERANGLLIGRFRRLQKVYCRDIKDICKLVMACCVLHNLCIICDDEIEDFIDVSQAQNVNNYTNMFSNLPTAVAVRDAIAATLP